jgi:hypothetical protein
MKQFECMRLVTLPKYPLPPALSLSISLSLSLSLSPSPSLSLSLSFGPPCNYGRVHLHTNLGKRSWMDRTELVLDPEDDGSETYKLYPSPHREDGKWAEKAHFCPL